MDGFPENHDDGEGDEKIVKKHKRVSPHDPQHGNEELAAHVAYIWLCFDKYAHAFAADGGYVAPTGNTDRDEWDIGREWHVKQRTVDETLRGNENDRRKH